MITRDLRLHGSSARAPSILASLLAGLLASCAENPAPSAADTEPDATTAPELPPASDAQDDNATTLDVQPSDDTAAVDASAPTPPEDTDAPDVAPPDPADAEGPPEPDDTATPDTTPAPELLCSPGTRERCYEGPPGTQNVGTCRGGLRLCAPDGLSFGPCEAQVLPATEGCAFSCDEDCDGRPAVCPSGERCDVAANACVPDATPTVVFGPEFAPHYRVFDLGAPPGVPGPLGGCILAPGDPDTLWIAGSSETANGAIHAVPLTRNACGHITGFAGPSTVVTRAPNVDANLILASEELLLFSMYNVNRIGQLHLAADGTVTAGPTLPLSTLGVVSSIGGLGVVPANLAGGGTLRTLSWSSGAWNRLTLSDDPADPRFLVATAASETTSARLRNGPGGFAYVPAGSPGFSRQSLIVSEWSGNSVGVYEVDGEGDPVITSRRDFFSAIPRPWGAYFEAATGDFLFLDWRSGSTRVYIVQGFLPPPSGGFLVKP
jgi:hypothetical protein